jgi:hypothetical protein
VMTVGVEKYGLKAKICPKNKKNVKKNKICQKTKKQKNKLF